MDYVIIFSEEIVFEDLVILVGGVLVFLWFLVYIIVSIEYSLVFCIVEG